METLAPVKSLGGFPDLRRVSPYCPVVGTHIQGPEAGWLLCAQKIGVSDLPSLVKKDEK